MSQTQTALPVADSKPHAMLLWQVLGTGLLVTAGLIGVAVYQNLTNRLRTMRNEMGTMAQDFRRDLARLGESHGSMIKKEDHNTRLRAVWDHIKELRADRNDLSTLRERCTMLTDLYRAAEEERRRLLADVRQVRESQAGEDERQSLLREIRVIRERLAQFEGGAKVPTVLPAGHAEDADKE